MSDTASDKTVLDIRAIGPDNTRIIRGIIELFHHAYQDRFPFRSAYQARFWKSHISSRFSSVIATSGDRVLAHLAAYPEVSNQRYVQICLAAFHPELGENTLHVAAQMWNLLRQQADRQAWELVYFLGLNQFPMLDRLAEEIFDTSPIAICPGYFPQAGVGKGREGDPLHHVVVTQRMFWLNHQMLSAWSDDRSDMRPVYPPIRHFEMTRRLYQQIGLPRFFGTENVTNEVTPHRGNSPRTFSKKHFPKVQASQIFVEPGEVRNLSGFLDNLEAIESRANYVFVNLEDPGCPLVSRSLEDHGYGFSGIVPFLQGPDRVLYFKVSGLEFHAAEFGNGRVGELASYIESATSSGSEAPILPRTALARLHIPEVLR